MLLVEVKFGQVARSVEVEQELVRIEATEDIAAAREAAERGGHQEAVEIIEKRRRAVVQYGAARDGDAMIPALEIDLRDMRMRVSNRQSYAHSGRAYMLASMFLVEVKYGEAGASLNPDMELRRLKQNFESWKKDFSSEAAAQRIQRQTRGNGTGVQRQTAPEQNSEIHETMTMEFDMQTEAAAQKIQRK